jgi:hypothetical protein
MVLGHAAALPASALGQHAGYFYRWLLAQQNTVRSTLHAPACLSLRKAARVVCGLLEELFFWVPKLSISLYLIAVVCVPHVPQSWDLPVGPRYLDRLSLFRTL